MMECGNEETELRGDDSISSTDKQAMYNRSGVQSA
jgi:hypothetical protein